MKGSSVIGRIVPIPQGTWNKNKQYKKLDIVYNEGVSYIARKDVPATELINNTEYWQVLAEGTAGVGETGPAGPTGPTGNVYYPTFDVNLTDGILYAVQYDDGPKFGISTNGDLYVDIM